MKDRRKALETFLEDENINCLNPQNVDDEGTFYISQGCDCCSERGKVLYWGMGYSPSDKMVKRDYQVCGDCLYFAAYGEQIIFCFVHGPANPTVGRPFNQTREKTQ